MRSDPDEDFNDWVLHNRERLYKRAYLICGNWHQADDLVQDALVKVYPRWRHVTDRGDPYPYVRRILVRACIDQGRRPSRRESPVSDLPDRASELPDSNHEQLLTALLEMPPRQRAVLVLRFWDALTIEETAAATGTSVGTVKSQSSRGMQTLRTRLANLPELKP